MLLVVMVAMVVAAVGLTDFDVFSASESFTGTLDLLVFVTSGLGDLCTAADGAVMDLELTVTELGF